MFRLMLLVPLSGVFLGCGADPADTSTPVDPATDGLVGAHDGHYRITMHREGGQFALGTFTVTRNVLTAEARSADGVSFTGAGMVDPDGNAEVTVENDAGIALVVQSATLSDGIVEARYTADGQKGTIVGSRDGALVGQTPVSDYDGGYEVAFVREADEVAVTTFEVKRGRFKTQVTAEDGALYELGGFITSDGTIVVLEAVAPTEALVMAEASIDQDTYAITGVYRAGPLVGTLHGRRSD